MSNITWTTGKAKLSDLIEYDKNPVQITERAANELAKSLKKFGHIIPYTAAAPKNGAKIPILDGHQRKKVEINILHVSPNTIVEVRFPSRKLTEKERQEAIIRLRKNTGEFDTDVLLNWFDGDDLLDWGFDTKELEKIGFEFDGNADVGIDIDRAAELLEKWQVKTGDLWQIGEHRLICGDCTDKAVVERVTQGEKCGACVTDPPYNVDKDKWDTDVLPMLKSAADLLPSVIGDGVCFWFCATRYIPDVIQATSALPYRWMFIWYPSNNMAHGDLGFQKFTAALVLSSGKIHRKTMQDLREYPIRITKDDPGHPTPKPIELIEYLVEQIDVDIYFDGFSGSGTTLVACENLSRRCRAIEISPAYVSVALERMEQAFGITGVRVE